MSPRDETRNGGEMLEELHDLVTGLGILLLPLMLLAIPGLILLLPLVIPAIPLAILAVPFLLIRAVRRRRRNVTRTARSLGPSRFGAPSSTAAHHADA